MHINYLLFNTFADVNVCCVEVDLHEVTLSFEDNAFGLDRSREAWYIRLTEFP